MESFQSPASTSIARAGGAKDAALTTAAIAMDRLRRWYFMGAFLRVVRGARSPRSASRYALPHSSARRRRFLGCNAHANIRRLQSSVSRTHHKHDPDRPPVPFVPLFDTELSRGWNAPCCV